MSADRSTIAIVGLGCRFPGADNPEELWELLRSGKSSVGEIPPDRFGDLDDLFDPEPATPGKIMSRFGGYLQDIDRMDAGFFGVAPREAELLDPQQRLLLEVAWEALEDAGQTVNALHGSSTGVFVGSWLQDFETRLLGDPTSADLSEIDFYTTTGSGRYNLSGRLSYFFGWQGPSVTLDTACSSSLVSIHLACSALRGGECGVALAGGVNVILTPYITVAYSQSRMMAQDGKCKFGDAAGDGYVRSEGCGMLVLKRLDRAIADGDRIYATIAGSAVNNDGRTSGFLATPGVDGQADLLQKAYAAAGIDPADVGYVEAHGTGTAAGDPVELEAIGRVLGSTRASGTPCRVGSIKTNLGHTEGAAGVAGVIKAALALHREELPASLHHHRPNPKIDWEGWKLQVPTETAPWKRGSAPRIAGISAFGISGTNAHIVLKESVAPSAASETRSTPEVAADASGVRLVPLSAGSVGALRTLAKRCAAQIELSIERGVDVTDLDPWIRGAAVRRSPLDCRAAFLARDLPQLAARMREFAARPDAAEGVIHQDSASPVGKIAFVFPGQGSQWLGMARQLMREEPVFRASMERLQEAMRDEVDRPLLDLLADPEPIEKIHWVQPLLFAIEVALADLWKSWGVEPDAVIGHSMGEAAAAAVAGSVSVEDACKVICRRSRLMLRQAGKGVMTVVELSLEDATEALKPYEGRLSVAVNNSPRSCVVSGDPEAMAEWVQRLESEDVYCRAVRVDVASHSPQMDPLTEDLNHALADVVGRAGSIPVYSTVDGEPTDGAHFDVGYWVRNLRQPVLFSGMVQRLVKDGHHTFIEMSAHPILLPAVQQNLDALEVKGATLASMRREEDEREVVLGSLGRLYAAGYDVDWTCQIDPNGPWIALPTHPWQRERFWYHDSGPVSRPAAKSSGGGRGSGSHPWLSASFEPLSRPDERWIDVHLPEPVSLGSDLGVATQWDLMLAAGTQATGRYGFHGLLRNWELSAAAQPSVGRLQLRLQRRGSLAWEVRLYAAGGPVSRATWVQTERPRARGRAGHQIPVEQVAQGLNPEATTVRAVGLFPFAADLKEPDRLEIADESGSVALVATGLETDSVAGSPGDYLYEIDWEPLSAPDGAERLEPGWLVVGPSAGSLVDRLNDNGTEARVVPADEASLIDAVSAGVPGILVAIDAEAELSDDADSVLERLLPLRAVAGMLASEPYGKAGEIPSLVIVASGHDESPALAAACGFARALDFEWPGVGCRMLLCDSDPSASDWDVLLATVAEKNAERRIRIHEGRRAAARLKRAEPKPRGLAAVPRENRPYTLPRIIADAGSPFVESAPQNPGEGQIVVSSEAAVVEGSHCLRVAGRVLRRGPSVEVPADGALVSCAVPDDFQPRWGSEIAVPADRAKPVSAPDAVSALRSDSSPDLSDEPPITLADYADFGADEGRLRLVHAADAPTHVAVPPTGIRPGSTYWVTGGLGALGRGTAECLVRLGARHLVLTARREPGAEARADIQRWQRDGVDVRTYRCDVAEAAQLESVLATIDRELPPLAGLFHVAGLLDDGLIANLTEDQYLNVFGPKISGAATLHRLLSGRPLDHFVMYGSAVAVLGTAGQANYVAANAYMDALAQQRRKSGLPAICIDWGPWAEVGLAAARADRGERLESQGLGFLDPQIGWSILERSLLVDSAQLVAMQFDVAAWGRTHPAATGDPFYIRLAGVDDELSEGPSVKILEALAQAGSDLARRGLLRDFVAGQVASVLRLDPSKVDPTRPFRALGFDSLMTLELRNRLEPPTGLKLSATMVWNYPNVHALADFLLDRLEESAEAKPVSESSVPATESGLGREDLEQMSEADAEALLAEKMAELDNL